MKISVYGLGKLGLPMMALLVKAGHEVIGVDLNEEYIQTIASGKAPFHENGLDELLAEVGPLDVTTDGQMAAAVTQVSMIVVPTPSQKDGSFTAQYVVDACKDIGSGIRGRTEEHVVVVVSTVMPGTCEKEVIPTLEQCSNGTLGKLFHVCYSPEFIALGTVLRDMANPEFILVGQTSFKAGDILTGIVRSYAGEVGAHHMSLVNAEIAKIALNTYVTMKISFANTLAEFCEKFRGGNADEVTRAIGQDSRIGVKCLLPATAFGGPCFPRDAIAFSTALSEKGVPAELAEATTSVNSRQAKRLYQKAKAHHLGPIGVLGLSYKAGTGVSEKSVGMDLVRLLENGGDTVYTYDPMVKHPEHGVDSLQQLVDRCSVVVICTPWPEFRATSYGGKKVIDCWGVAQNGTIERVGKG